MEISTAFWNNLEALLEEFFARLISKFIQNDEVRKDFAKTYFISDNLCNSVSGEKLFKLFMYIEFIQFISVINAEKSEN